MCAKSSERLDGWKAIAAYLQRSDRTVQRWEQSHRLPVHRAKAHGIDVIYAHREELDAWLRALEARGETADALDDDVGPPDVELPKELARPANDDSAGAGREPGRWLTRRPALSIGAAVVAVVAVSLASLPGLRPWARTLAATHPAPQAEAVRPHGFLDAINVPGPWPTQNHDGRRSNQSEYAGPVHPSAPELVFDAGMPLAPPGGYREHVTLSADGTMFFGTCGALLAVNRAGKEMWRQPLVERGFPLSVAGVSMDGMDVIVVAVRACTESPDTRKVKLMAFGVDGTPRWTQTRAGAYLGPLIAPDRTVYQMDEFNDIHAYQNGMMTWTVDLPGYAQGALAMDSKGALYVGTDANVYGQPSLWSLEAGTGRVRWSLGRQAFGTPVIGVNDEVYVVDSTGGLHAFTREGTERWSLPGEGSTISFEPLAIGRSGTVYLQTRHELVAVAPNGTIRWRLPLAEVSASPGPVLDKDENAYVAAGNAIYRVTSAGKLSWQSPIQAPGRLLMSGERELLVVSARQRILRITDREPSRRPTE